MTEEKLMSGVYAPVMTPYNVDLSIDHERLFLHCSWLISQGCGLAIFGTNSEANSLSVGERLDVLDILVGRGLNPKKMLPGTGCCSIIDSAVLTTKAIKLGCSGVLMLPPFYYKDVSDDGIFKNFSEIIERVGDSRLKIFLYHFPQMSGLHLSVEVIERLVKAFPDSIVGMKDSSGDITYLEKIVRTFPHFKMFVGSEALLLTTLRVGGIGCISATANINPKNIINLFDKWKSHEADSIQNGINIVRNIVQTYPMIPAMKKMLAHYSNDANWDRVRPPLTELSENQTNDLIIRLDKINFQMPGLLTK